MKGTILDFLNLAAEKPELATELLELATKYDFEFSDEELSEAELDSVAGGAMEEKIGDMMSMELQQTMNAQAQLMQMMSNLQKQMNNTADAIVQNLK
jgi:hypothetical protein